MTQYKSKYLIKDLMKHPNEIACVSKDALLIDAIESMGKSGIGIVCILNNDNSKLEGIITDGDLRRMLLKIQKPISAFFNEDAILHANINPSTIMITSNTIEAIKIMEKKLIWDLPVVNENNIFVGLFHLHPALKALLNE